MIVQPWSALGPNPNVSWYHKKRTWFVYVTLIYIARLLMAFLHINIALAWTIVNLIHSVSTFFALHWAKGSPFPHTNSKIDKLTVWEQIDNEEQYTPTKKVLTAVPIVLFLIAIHYNEYGHSEFFWNLLALGFALVPKHPLFHRVRLFGINDD
eukprot:TRINITY_DN2798_c0_g1_i1.p2 TRINITY_DN2798_c0_g1~~TRINITY_DN2798_c0_g1_i1.p2  ORF type:complete len:153 (-),score=27.31 TRINITY_DN2798_c0_g1_i1:1137-1595(-)